MLVGAVIEYKTCIEVARTFNHVNAFYSYQSFIVDSESI